jgi:hypothetical protein
MQQRGQTTTFQTRLEISVQSAAGLNDIQIALVVGFCVDRPQVATTMAKARTPRLHIADGTSGYWPDEYLCSFNSLALCILSIIIEILCSFNSFSSCLISFIMVSITSCIRSFSSLFFLNASLFPNLNSFVSNRLNVFRPLNIKNSLSLVVNSTTSNLSSL